MEDSRFHMHVIWTKGCFFLLFRVWLPWLHELIAHVRMWKCQCIFLSVSFSKASVAGFLSKPLNFNQSFFLIHLTFWLSHTSSTSLDFLKVWFELPLTHLPTYPLTRRNPIFIPLLLQLDSFWKNNFYVTYGIIQFSIWIIIYLDILVGGTNYCNDLRNNYLGHISKLKINYF